MTDWSILGGNPAPGSPGVFSAVAQALLPIVDQSESSSQSVRTMAQQAGSSQWSGVASQAFAESVQVIPADLGDLVEANQDAISALNTYSETLTVLQQQADQVLASAQNAQSDLDSASVALAGAQVSHSVADAEYQYYRLKVDTLEGEKIAANAVSDHSEAARLEAEIIAATQSRNAAWDRCNDASAAIRSAQSNCNAAQTQLANDQANANGIAAQRNEAIDSFVGNMNAAADFVVGQRSWIDRVGHDFESVTGILWNAARGVLDPSQHPPTKTDPSTPNPKSHPPGPVKPQRPAPKVVPPPGQGTTVRIVPPALLTDAPEPTNATDWAIYLLMALGIDPLTHENSVKDLAAQINLEQGSDAVAHLNPLNVGPAPFDARFGTWQDAVTGTTETIQSTQDSAMLAALQNDVSISDYAAALGNSNWEGHGPGASQNQVYGAHVEDRYNTMLSDGRDGMEPASPPVSQFVSSQLTTNVD